MACALETFVQLLEQDQHHANLACNPQIESILQKARSLRDLCVKHPKLGDLESRIRDVVYKAEDLIESRIRDHVLSVLKDDTSELDLKNFMEEFDYIKEELLNMQAHPTEDFMQEQEMLNIQADPEPASSATSRSSSVSDPDLNGKMVGLTEDFHQLMDQLVGQGLRLQIMPIVGMGGVGKTTMARQLFYHQRTVKHFDSRVWITIPQKRSVRVTLLAILGCLTNLTNEMHQRDDDQLCDSINMFLRYRRYLIIVDDIWDVNTWNTIRRVCPDNANRSRIILTTRVSTCYATNTSRHYKMRFMNADESWELLRLKVFGEESFPPELVHVGKMIAGRCQGLPQAIILMAQLLSKIEVKLEHWEHFAMNANSMEVQLDSGVDILSKSYNHLPYNLKPCFLYVGAFLGDHEIRVSRIVNLWIAEGFVRGQNLEDTAKAYLKALSDENLLLVCQEQPNGRMKTFKIHFLLRKLCAKKAFEEKFLWFKHLEGHRVPEDKDQLRRVSMHPLVQPTNTMELASFVRSLLCVGPYSQRLAPFFQGLTLLRVLDVFQVEFCQFPKEILELVLLRYLSFSCKSNLPSSISRLRNLQTIVIRRFTSFGEFSLPYELWELTQLRHVKCKVTCIWYFPHNGATQENLQTLSNIQVFVVTDSLLDNIPNLRKLGLFCNKLVLSAIHLDRLSKLEKLKCSSNLSQATHNFLSYLTFPPSLRKLTLVLCKIPCGFMDTVGLLPNLEQLKLRKCAFLVIENKPTEVALEMEEPEEETEPTWEQVEDQFSALISLQMEDLNLVHWKSNGVHFPKLEHLIIRGCSSLQELPVGIAERSSIKLIEVDEYCSPSVIASARDKQKKHIDLEDDIMQVDIGGKKETPTQVDEESSPSVIASTNDEQKQQIGKSQEPLIAPEARSQMNRQIGSVNRLQVHISLLGQRYSFFDKTVILEGIFCFFLLTRWVNDLWEVHIGGILQGLLVLYFSLVAWVNHFLQVHSGGSNSDLLPNTTGTFSKRLFCFFIVVLINTGNEVLQEYTGGILGDLLLYGAEISESYNFFLGYSDGHGHDLLLKSTAILPRFVLFLFFLGFGWIHLFFNTIDGIRRDFSHYMYSNEILQICSILFFFLIGWVNNFLQEHIDAIGSDLRDTTRILRTLFFVFFMILQWVYIFLKVQIRGFFRGPFLLYHTRILQGFLFALYSFILLLRWVNNLPLVSTASLKGLFYLFMLLGWVNDYLLRHIGRSQETLNEGHNEQHKIKGTVVLMKKKLMDIPDGFAFEMDCLYEAFGKGISFQLVSAVHGDPKSGRGKRGKATTLKDWVLSTSNEDRHTFRIAFPWDDSLGVPGALVVRNNHYSQFFLKMVTLEDIPEIGQLHFICNSWVYPANRYKNDRIFFANKAYLPCDTPEPLRSYRKKELKILRGNGSSMLREWDRIYDYASYNDLGSPENGPDSARPVLGGSKEYPYPRRGRTGRPPNKTDPNSESRLFILNPNIYLPRDEQFTQVKISAYIAYVLKLLGKVLVQTIPALSFYEKANDEFESFKDVLILYDRGYKLPGGHILQKFRKYIPWELLRELTRSDGAQLFKFPIPDVIKQNKKAWRTDEEFGREMLAGVNPIIIQRVQEFPPTSKLDPGVYGDQTSTITRKHIETHMNGLTVDEAIAKDKLFILDHHDAVMLYLRLINSTETKTYATRTLLLLQDDGTLKPLAIELSLPHEDGDLFGPVSEVYTPSEHGTQGSIWQLAKVYVAVNDSGYHQLISHWLNTHAVIEPFIIATNRQLSVLHPIHKLLQPHFRDTMHINALDRHTLINAGGILEKTFFPRRYAMEMSSAIYKNWNFTEQGLPEDLLKRGMAVKDPSQPRGLRLVIEDYPYAVDGLDIWSTIESWVRAYCDFYYLSDDKVKGDSELQSWWKEVREEGHGDLKDEQWWPKMETRAELIKTCTIIIWVTSALHAAVNFGQYAYGGYLPNRPSMSRRFMPKPGTPEYAELESKPELALQKTITTKYQTLLGVSLVEILSRHSTDEIYLGQRDNPHWTADDEPQEAFKLFRSELIEIEARIRGRNNDSKLRNRSGPVKIPYTLLYPNTSSEGRQGGLNVKGIPNSISI